MTAADLHIIAFYSHFSHERICVFLQKLEKRFFWLLYQYQHNVAS